MRFTVEASLNGETDRIKEYLIGREVFDRDDRYDPRLDPIVRVEARRLRARLEEYYGGPGCEDPLRIELPKGSYVPAIRSAAAESASRNGEISRKRWLWPATAGVVLVLAAGRPFLARQAGVAVVVDLVQVSLFAVYLLAGEPGDPHA